MNESGHVVVENDIAFEKERLEKLSPPYFREEEAWKEKVIPSDTTRLSGKQAVGGGDFGLVNYSNTEDITVEFGEDIDDISRWT